jgi:hypothetical protein
MMDVPMELLREVFVGHMEQRWRRNVAGLRDAPTGPSGEEFALLMAQR